MEEKMKKDPQNLDIRILYSDIDGTLLRNDHHISPKTREKILELDKKGIPFILVSARMPDGVRLIQRELGNKRPIICYSGGLILDEDQNVIYSRQMDLELAAGVWSDLERVCPEICVNIYGGELWVVKDDQNPWVIREEGITEGKSAVGELRNMFAGTGGIHKFLLMGEPEDIARGEVFLKANYPKLSVLRSNSYYLEVMDGSVDKAEGVRFLCDRYGIPISRAAAFGDGENDLGMLRAAGYGFAMGNASEKLKAQVGHTTLSNEEEGILRVLERIESPKKAY